MQPTGFVLFLLTETSYSPLTGSEAVSVLGIHNSQFLFLVSNRTKASAQDTLPFERDNIPPCGIGDDKISIKTGG
jgi:hypothetical protein